jgi:two-component system OmpR family sensor kinase
MRLGAARIKPLRDWTLRTRLVASMLGLLAVLCIAIGSVTEVALQHFLMGRLDDQLNQAGGRFSRAVEDPPPQASGRPTSGDYLPRGQAPGTIGAHLSSTETSSGQIRGQSADSDLSSGALAALRTVSADNHPHTVSLPGIGSYRVIASTTPDGDVLVTGLPLTGVTDTLASMTLVVTALTTSGLVIAGFAGTFIVRLALRPLRRVTTTASKVAEMPLDEGEVALAVRVDNPNPHTEVGQVGVALNRMLENVSDALNARHRSETRVRQFVADASHELRTPLASIRGYAELTRRSREVAPPDIAYAMSRVESEADRMTTLVEDLLLLARLDAGRPLEAAEVDLSRLVVDVLSDAHVAGPDHRWHLDLPNDPVLVIGDQARLHQVLANLLSNARNHTHAGTNVWIALSAQGNTASVKVADDGPGIPPDLVGDIFERFSRGEQSRSRAAGSTGLGLAIVNAVLNAHHGSIAVNSKPGRTVFTVCLPMHANHQADAQDSSRMVAQHLSV